MSAAERVAAVLERWERAGWNPRQASESEERAARRLDLYTEERDR